MLPAKSISRLDYARIRRKNVRRSLPRGRAGGAGGFQTGMTAIYGPYLQPKADPPILLKEMYSLPQPGIVTAPQWE
jgi:hypothetical protein